MAQNPSIKKMIEVRDYCDRRIVWLNGLIQDAQAEKAVLVDWMRMTEDEANKLARLLEIELPEGR